MNYFVLRGDQQYGPYTLAELQLFTQQGHIAATDLARSEAMENWIPASQITGNISVPAAGGTGFGVAPQTAWPIPADTGNVPPNLHWGAVLALSIVTCSLFGVVWTFIEAVYVRKLRRGSNAILYLSLYALTFVAPFLELIDHKLASFAPFLNIVGWVFYVSAVFSMKSTLEDYYNSEENIALHLSGLMTFFFGVCSFQFTLTHTND